MAVHTPLKVDHQVLGEDFCSGYMDPFGNWNTGFPCPRLDEETPGLCCGVDNLKYCCNGHGPRHIVNDVTHLPLVMGVVFGMSVAMIVSVVVCCFKCSCCLLYKKRQPANTGPLYHLHCSSSGSAGGVANMYSFSSDATPQDTPRSSTRSHRSGANNRWSTATADSGPGLLSLDHHLALLEDTNPATVHASFRPGPHNLSEGDRLSNNGSGGRLPSSIGLGRALTGNTVGSLTEDEELPPPYNSNHSTLIAVRTNHAHQGQYTQPATNNDVNNTTNSTSRISNITTATNNHPGSLSRTPPPPSLSSSTSSSNTLPQGFPTFLHQHHQQQHSLSSSGAPSPRPHLTQSRPQQRHSVASVASEDSFSLGFPAFPPPPSEATASPASTASNIFSLPAPPPPSLTLPQSLSLHHNHHQQHNNNNWHHQRSSSLYNPCSNSSHCSNSSSGTFAPVLSPTRRPCSTAHIVHMHSQNPPLEQQHMYTATKF